LRFWNNQVLQEMDGVLEAIRQVVISPPSHAGEGGAIALGEGSADQPSLPMLSKPAACSGGEEQKLP